MISGETYKVTFNGVEYECTVRDNDGLLSLGAPYDKDTDTFDFSEYPFEINNDFDPWGIITPEAGTYTVKIEHLEDVVETTPEFEAAVSEAMSNNPSGGAFVIECDCCEYQTAGWAVLPSTYTSDNFSELYDSFIESGCGNIVLKVYDNNISSELLLSSVTIGPSLNLCKFGVLDSSYGIASLRILDDGQYQDRIALCYMYYD